jgi:hypothetical protein
MNEFPTSPESKRKKVKKNNENITTEAFPALSFSKKSPTNPKFIVLTSMDENRKLSSISPFALKKALDGISTQIQEYTFLRDGSMLILANNENVANKFISQKNLANLCPIKATYHQHLNNCKGTIYDRLLINVSEEEIIQNLANQGVVEVFKFKRNLNDKIIPTGLILLTFNLFNLPSKLKIAWYEKEVRPYYPNPMRCKSCQKLGHTTKRCNNDPICENCNLPPHNPDKCSRTLCANCLKDHSAASKLCPMYQMMKEILKIKTRDKITIRDARKKYKEANPTIVTKDTFSDILKNKSSLTSKTPIQPENKQTENNKKTINENITSKEKSPAPTSSICSNNNININKEKSFENKNISNNLENNSNNLKIPPTSINTNKSSNVKNDKNVKITKISPVTNVTAQNENISQVAISDPVNVPFNDSEMEII